MSFALLADQPTADNETLTDSMQYPPTQWGSPVLNRLGVRAGLVKIFGLQNIFFSQIYLG